MAQQDLAPSASARHVRLALLALALSSAACGGATPDAKTANLHGSSAPASRPYPEAPRDWGAYRSARFRMTIPLPTPRAWTIDDRSRAELVAVEPATHSKLVVLSEIEEQVVGHQGCEERARTLGLVPAAVLQPVEDSVIVGPAEYDTRVFVAIERGAAPDKKLVGHLFAFGGHLRKCLVVHLATEVPSEDDEQALSQRLALARLRTLGGIKVAEVGTVPRGTRPP